MWLLTFDQIHEKPNAITWRPLALLELERRISLDNGSPPCDGVEQTCRRGISKLGNSPAEHKPPLHWAVPKTSIAYRALAGLANALVPLVARGSGKLAQGDRARRAALDQWLRWSTTHRDRSRPLLWVHAPSVGEGLQANAVLERLRRRNPSWQIVYSFFSPSAEQLATRQPVDYAGYLPYDTRSNVGPLLEMLAPTALVFTKLDLWPELSTGAAARGVKLGMIAATVSAVSRRGHPIARILTQPGYQALDRIGAVAEPDATRLIGLGARPAAITITGDPRFDSALERARAIAADDPLRRLTAGAPTLVAGSTWPADERVLLDAYRQVRNRHPDARLVLVPHETTQVKSLTAAVRRAGWPQARLSELGDQIPAVVIVDRVGALATIYAGARVAYVGGGFGAAGLHSVLEPAAVGVPVIVGPRWQSSREAHLLIAVGGARSLTKTEPEADLAESWADWLDPGASAASGAQALAVVTRELGAADRNAALVEELLATGRGP